MHGDLLAADRIGAQHPGPLGLLGDHLPGLVEGQLIRGHVIGQRAGGAPGFDVGPVAADAHIEGAALVLPQGDGADGAGIGLFLGGLDQRNQALFLSPTLVEALEVAQRGALALGDGVQARLQAGGEVVVHELPEVALHQVGHREGGPGGDQSGTALEGVAPGDDGLDDRGVGAGAADAAALQLLDQGGLAQPARGLGAVPLALQLVDGDGLALGDRREHPPRGLAVAALGGDHVGPAVARELNDLAGGPEERVLDPGVHAHPLAGRVLHLAGDRALPDQLVEPGLVRAELPAALLDGAEAVAGGADGLVGLLGALGPGLVAPGGGRQVVLAVGLAHQGADGGDGLLGEVGGVGAHVGDPAVLVQALGHGHGAPGRPPQPPVGLLLQGGGDERRRGALGEPAALHPLHGAGFALQALDQGLGGGLIQSDDLLGDLAAELAGAAVEVPAAGEALAAELHQVAAPAPVIGA